MYIVKLIVLYCYTELLTVYGATYCEICVNHTLCLFPNPGAGPNCKDYEGLSLTKDNINEIVNRINEKRNYVSLGLSKYLPPAANMRKINWSNQLAVIAQRWADQCDQSIFQDREDSCRDLGDDVSVGQNIATILGSTSRLNVKSFVDIWYMRSIDYTGSVTFYNESRDRASRFFTQLIWAETSSVGCGRVKFSIIRKNTTAEKLVCNFAPKGNVNGKPVYMIGYPITQCPSQTEMDSTYPGLCQIKDYRNVGKFTTQCPPASGLLRILNLSNNSVKREIDPIPSNLKQINYEQNKTSSQRNPRIRHVPTNRTHVSGSVRSNPSLRSKQHYRKGFQNRSSQNFETFHQVEQFKGHSKIYHEYQTRIEHFDSKHKGNNEDFIKYGFSTEPINVKKFIEEVSRKHNMHINHCTRKMGSSNYEFCVKNCATNESQNNKCTRRKFPHTTYFYQTQTCPPCTNTLKKQIHDLCICNEKTIINPNPIPCKYNLHYKFVSTELSTTPQCLHFRSLEDNFQQGNPLKHEFKLYDSAPVQVPLSGEVSEFPNSSSYDMQSFSIFTYPSKKTYHRKSNQGHNDVKLAHEYSKLIHTADQYYNMYDVLDSNKRIKRDNIDQITFRPFWQVDQYNNKNPSDLRSIRYTTLANKINKKISRPAISTKPSVITEVITINIKDLSTNKKNHGHISEKYLSFDELMHIRKLSTIEINLDARRKINDTNILREGITTTTPASSVPTIETPFARKKHCTRKLTCTWTAFTVTGSDGNIILPNRGGDFGSRTPPGYVDGCTRTSTCTRDFQDRNKITTILDLTSFEPNLGDEDYCERRSLDLHRRDSEIKDLITVSDFQKSFENYHTTPYNEYDVDYKRQCECDQKHSRNKRDEINDWKKSKNNS